MSTSTAFPPVVPWSVGAAGQSTYCCVRQVVQLVWLLLPPRPVLSELWDNWLGGEGPFWAWIRTGIEQVLLG